MSNHTAVQRVYAHCSNILFSLYCNFATNDFYARKISIIMNSIYLQFHGHLMTSLTPITKISVSDTVSDLMHLFLTAANEPNVELFRSNELLFERNLTLITMIPNRFCLARICKLQQNRHHFKSTPL